MSESNWRKIFGNKEPRDRCDLCGKFLGTKTHTVNENLVCSECEKNQWRGKK